MTVDPETLRHVAAHTEVVRSPKQALATFGETVISYYLVTEPAYGDLAAQLGINNVKEDTVVRKGRVRSERPLIVTPYYLLNLFHGFEHGREFARHLRDTYGASSPGLMYSYTNELVETSVVSDPLPTVVHRLIDQLDENGEALAAVIRGVDQLWDVSLMKFIFELTAKSMTSNVADLGRKGLLGEEDGLPRAARARLEEMFRGVAKGEVAATDLKSELDRWGVFDQYEDRFLDLFRCR